MESKFVVGDLIKAFDFEPRKSGVNCYVVGIIKDIGFVNALGEFTRDYQGGYMAMAIDCVYDTMPEAAGVPECSRVGRTVYVPVQTSMDYDGRVTKV